MPHGRVGDETIGHRGISFLHGISHLALTTRLTPSLPAVSVPALVAAGALAVAVPGPARAACTPSGATITCTGATTTAQTVTAGQNLVLPDGANSIRVDAGTGFLSPVVRMSGPGSSITIGDRAAIEQTGAATISTAIWTQDGATTITVRGGGRIDNASYDRNARAIFANARTALVVEEGGGVTASRGRAFQGLSGVEASIENSGTIESRGTGAGSQNAILLGSGTLTNTATGRIFNNRDVTGTAVQVTVLSLEAMTLTNAGLIENLGTGLVILTSNRADTVINSGTLRTGGADAINLGGGDDVFELQPGSAIAGNVLGGTGTDTLRFGGTGADSFNLDDIDTGAGTQQYREFQTFQVTGGDWTFTGTTPVVLTQTGGTIMGTGTFGDLTLDGGTIAPGNSIGTITVTGDVVFNAGSTYRVEIDDAGNSDLIAANGMAIIATTGTTLDIVGAPGGYPDTSPTYTILAAAGGVTGQFATITDNLPDLDFRAIYNATNVQIVYTKASAGGGATPTTGGGTPTFSPKEIQGASLSGGARAGYIFGETLRRRGGLVAAGGFSGGTSESMSLGYMAGSTAFGSPAAGSPTSFAGLTGTGSETLPPHVLAADMPQVPIADMPIESHEPRQWAVWGAGLGSMTDVDASGGVPGWDAATGGVAFGVERRANLFGTPSVVGVAFGFTSSDVDSGTSGADIESYHLGLYAASSSGPLTLSGAVAYAFQEYDYTRVVPFGGGAVTALGSADGHALTAGFEAFYDVANHYGHSDIRFGPLVTLDSVYAERDGFTETGAGILNLTVAGDDMSQVVTGLGVAASLTRAVGATLVTLDGRVAWEHVFGDRQVTTTSTIPVAGATFVTASAPIDRDRVALDLGAALEMSDTVSAHLRYDGAVSGATTDHRGSAGLTVRF